ncbi:MAG: ATP-binding protein [Ktedonobacteraceae bacterium]|nr:ATP-binding protein [Ktedonobacteraceae bacterium]MBA3822484.1 ATP-binding protein [Ktedonobacterales bacterium]
MMKAVGITKGPGETPHEYTFISSDEDQILKTGEYVWYALSAGGGEQRVLGRITERRSVQQYPDTFLAEPSVPPAEVAALVGFDRSANDLFELRVDIMGYYDVQFGAFINPWIPPQSGRPIYLADDAMLAHVLSKREQGAIGSAHLGDLLTRAPGAVPIIIDVRELVSTHLAIIASTGAGKSYLAGVLIEELLRSYNRAAVVIIDPHGEYGTLTGLANHDEFTAQAPNGREVYRPATRIFRHDQVKVRISTLTLGDMRYLLPEMTDKQQALLAKGFKLVRDKHKGQQWDGRDLIRAIKESAGGEEGERDDTTTVGALEWKIEQRFVDNDMTFSPSHHLELREICQPGQCTVLQINEIDERDQQVIVATVLRRIYDARRATDRDKVHAGDEKYLPYPVFILVEEAHHFAPSGTEVVSTRVLKEVLAEGRKFGMGVGLISQRPGKLDADVLSQCQTQCIMRIVNELDQKTVATAVESVGHELLRNLPALSKGQVIVAGSAVNTPVLCRVRPRITKHGGESHDAPAKWQAYFAHESVADRARTDAITLRNDTGPRLYRE